MGSRHIDKVNSNPGPADYDSNDKTIKASVK